MASSGSLADFAAKGAKKAVGVAAFGTALHLVMEHFFPGQASPVTHATASAGALIASYGPTIKDFAEHLYSKLSSLFASYEANQYFAEKAQETSEHSRRFNHDIELQFGRTLATLLREWASRKQQIIGAFVTQLASRAEEEAINNKPPRWLLAANAVKLDVRLDALRDLCLNAGRVEPGSYFLKEEQWTGFLHELSGGLQDSGAFSEYKSLWTPLGKHLEARFPSQFYNDMKAALTNPAHAKAWAAMQYRVDALILSEIRTVCDAAESAASNAKEAKLQALESRQAILLLGSRCAADARSLWQKLDAVEQGLLANLKNEIEAAHAEVSRQLADLSRQLDEFRHQYSEGQ